MSTDTLFLERISTLRKLALVRALQQVVLLTLLIFLCIYTIAVGLEKIGVFYVRGYILFYALSLGISLGFALVYGYIKREFFANILIDIDTRLKLQDRISTAYEYQTLGKHSELTDLLVEDASHRLSLLSNKQLFPPKFSYIHLLLSVLLVINIAFIFIDQFLPVPRQMKVDQEQADKISTLLQSYTRKRPESENKVQEKAQRLIHENLDDIVKKLDERSVSQKELVESLNTVLQEVQSDQQRLSKELGSKLEDIKTLENLPIRQIPQLQFLSATDLKKLQQMLKQMLDNQLPMSIEQDLANLDANHSLMELLKQILEDVESEPDDGNGSASDTGETVDQDNKDLGKDGDPTQDGEQDETSSDGQQDEGNLPNQAGSDRGYYNEGGEELEGDFSQSDEGSSSEAGRGESDGQTMSPYDFDQSEGPAFQDKVISGQKADYNIHIRSVTTIGKTTLPEEDVTRPYQQELESILQKEDIPVNYREYIKNYFISIGLRKEDNTNGNPK